MYSDLLIIVELYFQKSLLLMLHFSQNMFILIIQSKLQYFFRLSKRTFKYIDTEGLCSALCNKIDVTDSLLRLKFSSFDYISVVCGSIWTFFNGFATQQGDKEKCQRKTRNFLWREKIGHWRVKYSYNHVLSFVALKEHLETFIQP